MIDNIKNLINSERINEYSKNYMRIKSGKKFNIHFIDYSKEYIIAMVGHFESVGDYDKSSFLNLNLNLNVFK